MLEYEIMMCHYNIVPKSEPVISEKLLKSTCSETGWKSVRAWGSLTENQKEKTEIVDFAN